jgi:hypothetical protein
LINAFEDFSSRNGGQMKLGDLCHAAPCFSTAASFEIPSPGATSAQFKFDEKEGRAYYAVLLRNHDISNAPDLNPRVAVVGLSPGGNQIDEFRNVYSVKKNYVAASIDGAFAGLHQDIIAMFKGLGIAEKFDLRFPNPNSIARDPDIFGTSLVACASLWSDGSSDDFNLADFEPARRCMTMRFVKEILNPAFTRLSHVFILGIEGWKAIQTVKMREDITVLQHLQDHGKTVLMLPHPRKQNQAYVKLASLPSNAMPKLEKYLEDRWTLYLKQSTKHGKQKKSESEYKSSRKTIWVAVDTLRKEIAKIDHSQ